MWLNTSVNLTCLGCGHSKNRMSDNQKRLLGSKPPPPPPPPQWAQDLKDGANRPGGMTLPRVLIIALTILGLFFIFRVVKNQIHSNESVNTSETAAADLQESSGGDSNTSPDLPPVVSPQETSPGVIANASAPQTADSPPTVNPSMLNSNLSGVESDLRRFQAMPNLTIYVRIVRNMRLMVLAQIAILESLSDAPARKSAIQSLRKDNANMNEINDSSYQTFSIAAYSHLAGKAGGEFASAITIDKSDNDLKTCMALLENPADDLLIATRNGVLALVYAHISIGRTRSVSEASTAQIWANYSRAAAAIMASDDHILRQIEKAHQLLYDVLRSCCTTQDSGQATSDELGKIDSAHRTALGASNNLYDKIGIHTDASVQAMLLYARNMPAHY